MTAESKSYVDHLEAASHWFAVLSDEKVTPQEKQAWQAWMAADAAHRLAWSKVESVGAMFDAFQQQGLSHSAHNVLQDSQSRRLSRRQFAKGLMALMGSLGLGWYGWDKADLSMAVAIWNADLNTQIGELKQLSLADGSTLWLNTRTGIQEVFDNESRTLQLISGEAFFQVSDDSQSRPFYVTCPHGLIHVTSEETRFCLRHLSDQQGILAVYQGQVELNHLSSSSSLTLKAGQEVRLHAHSMGQIQPALAMYEAWTRGQLVVDDMALKDFIKEVGRYHHGYLHLDASLQDWRISGTFPTQNRDVLFAMLEGSFPVKVNQVLPWWVNVSAIS
jgi:transmembrane sensor